jgi:hypothetical protein
MPYSVPLFMLETFYGVRKHTEPPRPYMTLFGVTILESEIHAKAYSTHLHTRVGAKLIFYSLARDQRIICRVPSIAYKPGELIIEPIVLERVE